MSLTNKQRENSVSFDITTHTYTRDGVEIPGVTKVLRDLIPGWSAGEWYLERGVVVHACAAMIAQDVSFEHDPQVDGQVRAIRRFFYEVQPEVISIEQQVYSELYDYAGRTDLVCKVYGKKVVLDYKASVSKSTPYQLAGYAIPLDVNYGVSVEIHDDGTYKMSKIYNLKQFKNGWLALLSAYRIRRLCGIKETKGE